MIFDTEPFFNRLDVGDIVHQCRTVVQAVGQRDDLIVGKGLGGFFKTSVEIADLVDVGQDGLAVEGGQDADGTMGRRMRRSEIEKHDLGIDIADRIVIIPFHMQSGPDLLFHAVGLKTDLSLADGIVLAQGDGPETASD